MDLFFIFLKIQKIALGKDFLKFSVSVSGSFYCWIFLEIISLKKYLFHKESYFISTVELLFNNFHTCQYLRDKYRFEIIVHMKVLFRDYFPWYKLYFLENSTPWAFVLLNFSFMKNVIFNLFLFQMSTLENLPLAHHSIGMDLNPVRMTTIRDSFEEFESASGESEMMYDNPNTEELDTAAIFRVIV